MIDDRPEKAAEPGEMRWGAKATDGERGGGAAGDIDRLILRMRSGDREAAALFLTRYGTRIRRRVRGKLSPSMRRLFDSLEIMSTLGRRLDRFVLAGRLEATTEPQLWSLMFEMANHAVVDKARLFRRLQQVEDDDSVFAEELSRRLHRAGQRRADGAEAVVDVALRQFDDHVDRLILANWLADTSLVDIADIVSLRPAAVRKRWQRIRAVLRERLLAESHP